jgi:sensor histidine kinase regulating citrate/malate metabolism
MTNEQWINNIPAAITITDDAGKITLMNEKSISTFASYGGEKLIGKNLSECHLSNSTKKINQLINNKQSNTYTIEKNGIKKLIYQVPIFEEEKYLGMVELSIVLPENMNHFVRE